MTIRKVGNTIKLDNSKQEKKSYMLGIGSNGKPFVKLDSVASDVLHISDGNSKTGPCLNFNFPVEMTCDHRCDCYASGKCYACSGCYLFASNQLQYAENLAFFRNNSGDEFTTAVQIAIDNTKTNLFRWFTCGDIPNKNFLSCMVEVARNNPTMKFWSYTKKYAIVNSWIAENGELPENLKIIFSHWLNDDGTYFPMENPYKMPTSEFIPYGKEQEAEKVTHVCPCSDPTKKVTCATCDHPCYTLNHGESMALLEHSTIRTKERDKAIKEAKNNL